MTSNQSAISTTASVLFIALSLVGIVINMFIISVNFHSWIKGQSMNPSDLLIVSLAFSNMVFSVTDGVYTICILVIPFGDVEDQLYLLYIVMVYVLFCNSWLSACLCFYYFVKISNVKPGYLARLKSKINTLVPRLILVAQGFSILNSLFYMPVFFKENVENPTNQTQNITTYRTDDFYNVFFLLINCYIPFLVILVTTSLIIASLYKHTRRMQQNMGEVGGPSLKIHQRAARTMTSLLILYLLFYVVVLGSSLLIKNELLSWVYYLVGCTFSPIQSIILIMGNTRLKKTFVNMLNSCRKTFGEEDNVTT
uniref:Taste receptor type 2 n=1 Tax=Xenopus tropicalis TaxID=8364 RepID=F7D474_XENTR